MSWITTLLSLLKRKPVPVPPIPVPGTVAEALLAAHNAARDRPLKLDARLTAAAQKHAEVMAARHQRGHVGLGDGEPWDRVTAQGYRYVNMAENVAEGQPDASAVVTAWLSDFGHRINVLGPFLDFGGGMARSTDGTPYWVCDYGRES